eukprot:04197.XXX_42446_46436_1 [CDS] Oithona nana genome sequencing.
MAHWSSHGYLAKANDNSAPNMSKQVSEGYVVLKRQGDSMITQTQQPQSLPVQQLPNANGVIPRYPQMGQLDLGDRKYYSVKGYGDFRNKHTSSNMESMESKYLSVDARYHSMKALPPEIRAKLREMAQQEQQQQQNNPYQAPPVSQFQHQQPFAPAPPPRTDAAKRPSQPPPKPENIQKGASGNSVSWHEWTQQLQAYIAWVNSQLRKRPELRPVQDLRTDLQSGEVLAQLIEIISGEKIAGIQYAPESLQGMRENIERILQFMASKRIKMHQITSKEVLEGNLKAVMRLILALAAHYKPQSVRHHDTTFDNSPESPVKNNPPPVEETTLNQTHDSVVAPVSNLDSMPSHSNSIKRSPSLNEGHYAKTTSKTRIGQLDLDSSQIYENFSSGKQQAASQQSNKLSTKATIEAIPTSKQNNSSSDLLNTSLPSPVKREATLLDDNEDKNENRKSKPKALEFWESMDQDNGRSSDFRYNTIHRMSVGRRMLPKAPEVARSQSLDRTGELKSGSLDSSFSGGEHDSVKMQKPRMDSENGCSLQSHGSAQPSQPSPPSSDSRGEVEGSSDNNSPPTSVIQGKTNQTSDPWDPPIRSNPTYDWLRSGFKPNGKIDDETLLNQLRQQRLGDGHSGSDSKHSDTMSDQGNSNIPYDILLQDLTQAKRQLLELHNLVTNPTTTTSSIEQNVPNEFAQCVENISVLNLRLKNSEERCQLLKSDLRQAKQECATLEGSKNGLQSRLSEQELATSQLKQDLVRVTLAKQTLEYEKKELLRRVDELERGLTGVKNENGEKDKLIRAAKQQIEEFARKQRDFNLAASAAGLTPNGEPDLKALYDEELAVAKDAISNLRSSFSGSDPSQHILDTLEQCISVIIEKIQRLDQDRNGSRMSSIDYNKANEGLSSNSNPVTTKILYFTNRSVTPFMSTMSRKIGEITLRDFKVLFDRPGFYRFHFKSVDQEFGMVKEEISSDDMVLPGSDGKIVAWVEED